MRPLSIEATCNQLDSYSELEYLFPYTACSRYLLVGLGKKLIMFDMASILCKIVITEGLWTLFKGIVMRTNTGYGRFPTIYLQ